MLIIAGILDSYRSLKDKTLKITFQTNEPNAEQILGIAKNTGSFGFMAFKHDDFKQNEIEALEGLKSDYNDTGKSKAQRLRGVLYRCFENDPKGYDVFDDYYNHYMERIIDFYKDKIES